VKSESDVTLEPSKLLLVELKPLTRARKPAPRAEKKKSIPINEISARKPLIVVPIAMIVSFLLSVMAKTDTQKTKRHHFLDEAILPFILREFHKKYGS
jgi:hypothetical protein